MSDPKQFDKSHSEGVLDYVRAIRASIKRSPGYGGNGPFNDDGWKIIEDALAQCQATAELQRIGNVRIPADTDTRTVRSAELECETCNGDPAVCAAVPGLRHCEAANRSQAVGGLRSIEVKPLGDALLLTSSRMWIIGDWFKGSWRTHRSTWEGEPPTIVLKSAFREEDIIGWMPLPDPTAEVLRKPFWKWKEEQIAKDGFKRESHWYFRAYGGYCEKVRTMRPTEPQCSGPHTDASDCPVHGSEVRSATTQRSK